MNSKEILKADLLDILFENRNKEYGAYALRREYSGRMMKATSFVFFIFLFLVLIAGLNSPPGTDPGTGFKETIVNMSSVDDKNLQPFIPPPPEQRIQQQNTPREERLFTDVIEIRPDNTVLNTVPSFTELATALPSDQNRSGTPDDHRPFIPAAPNLPVIPKATTPIEKNDFEPDEREAEFPGGPEALRNFMALNLVTPDELDPGETRSVHIRFVIGKDGSLSEFEIVKSGGYSFDREVTRVCRKLPRWKPARQNGFYVPVTFMLPVTFVSIEQ